MKILKPVFYLTVIALVCSFGNTATAQTTDTTVVNDNFADGDRSDTGTEAAEADWFGSSNANAIESNAGSVGLVSGSSGRQIHAIFDTISLNNVGDHLCLSLTFQTPATVSAGSDDLRFGIFDHAGRGAVGGALFQDTSYSTTNPNADYSGLEGYFSEFDVESSDPASDYEIRRSNPSTSGRLLATTGGFTSLPGSSGPDVGYAFVADTEYTITYEILHNAAGGLDITVGGLGGSDLTLTDAAPGTFDFNMIGLGASTDAFGTSNTVGDADNGIDITNLTIVSKLVTAIPEPGSATLLLSGLFSLGLIRRRNS